MGCRNLGCFIGRRWLLGRVGLGWDDYVEDERNEDKEKVCVRFRGIYVWRGLFLFWFQFQKNSNKIL